MNDYYLNGCSRVVLIASRSQCVWWCDANATLRVCFLSRLWCLFEIVFCRRCWGPLCPCAPFSKVSCLFIFLIFSHWYFSRCSLIKLQFAFEVMMSYSTKTKPISWQKALNAIHTLPKREVIFSKCDRMDALLFDMWITRFCF